jgi:hypothetical protein
MARPRTKFLVVTAVVFIGTGALAAAVGPRTPAVNGDGACNAGDARIVVDLTKHVLRLCDGKVVVGSFPVWLGRGGTGKRREGDGRTPVGAYQLGQPRASNRFGTFIPIEYPTEEQKKQGYTGGAVGIHGPPRWARWLGSLVSTFDLSQGCVGLARDAEIEQVANWVRARSVQTIELH